jgi:hydroxymethylpyrimidine/phosphomethylpyrimidine kinase
MDFIMPFYKKNKILIIAGLDPTGGAGINADIQTAANLNCHSCPIVSVLTSQRLNKIHKMYPIDETIIQKQLEILTKDVEISYCKLGMLGTALQMKIITGFCQKHNIKIICDPVLFSGGNGKKIQPQQMIQAYKRYILPHAYIITPNTKELSTLGNTKKQENAINQIFNLGCKNILVTAGDKKTNIIKNVLYQKSYKNKQNFNSKKIQAKFHGTGCTLSTAITCYLCKGHSIAKATELALIYTTKTVKKAYSISAKKTQFVPNKMIY